jgi:hypothetical protein
VTAVLTDLAYRLNGYLFGPGSPVPWWAWVAMLAMILWGLLVRGAPDG